MLLPCGYHGPSMAAPGYDLYYLNVMAGPGERAWRFTDDPAHAWIRDTWEGQEIDPRLPMTGEEADMRLTVAQALVRFLAVQYSERDGVEQRLIAGCFGIFGHGNVAGVGQALLEQPEDDAVRASRATSRRWSTPPPATRAMKNRLSHLACTASVGPGATNMVTGAALATINRAAGAAAAGRRLRHPRRRPGAAGARGPALARRLGQRHASSPSRASGTASTGPSSSPRALLAAMRVLTDPAETGAVTLALPQDVQAEAYDWPEELFAAPRLARAPPAGRARGARRRPPSCCAARGAR